MDTTSSSTTESRYRLRNDGRVFASCTDLDGAASVLATRDDGALPWSDATERVGALVPGERLAAGHITVERLSVGEGR